MFSKILNWLNSLLAQNIDSQSTMRATLIFTTLVLVTTFAGSYIYCIVKASNIESMNTTLMGILAIYTTGKAVSKFAESKQNTPTENNESSN